LPDCARHLVISVREQGDENNVSVHSSFLI
jgi:hypothetical protein